MVIDDKQPKNIDVDELAKGKVEEIETLLESRANCNVDSINSWLSILKQIITAADLHRTNDNTTDKDKSPENKSESGESIYADYGDDNERIHAVDLTEQFATNNVKWTIRVRAFKIVHRLIQLLSHASTSNSRSNQASRLATLKHIPDLVRLSFVAATSPYDELKVQGFIMFRFLIDKFASMEEPEYPGHSILEQYKTQVFSAIKPAFNLDAPPYITGVASQVCSLWICKGLEKDTADLRRAYQLMLLSIHKLENQSVNQNSKLYTESELEQERVEILGAWAQLYIAATEYHLEGSIRVFNCLEKQEANTLHSLVLDHMPSLTDKWWEALKDYALLIMPAPRLIGSSHDNEQVYTREVALKLFAPIWPKLVFASTIWLCRPEFITKSIQQNSNDSKSPYQSCESSPKTTRVTTKLKYFKFICGIIMKNLCKCQTLEDKSRGLLPEETVYSIRSLYLLLSTNQISSVPIDDGAIAQEFYTLLYAIQINYCRDPNRPVIRTTLDLIFKSTLAQVVRDKRNVHYGLARLVASLMATMKDIEIACREKSKTLDIHRVHLSIRLHNLIALIRESPEVTMQEIPLREAVLIVFQEMLQFEQEPIVGLAVIDRLQDFYQLLSPDNLSYFVSNIFKVQTDRVAELLINATDEELSKSNFVLETHLNSMRSTTNLQVSMKSTLVNSYVEMLLDCSSAKQSLLDMCTRQINLLRKVHQSSFDESLDPKCRDKLSSIIKTQEKEENIKSKASLALTKKQVTTKSNKPQAAKITLRADFSNFYTK